MGKPPRTTPLNNESLIISKAPEGHHPRGTTLREALRGNLPLTEGSAGVSQRALRGLSEGSAGLCGGPLDFPRFSGGSDPMLVTLGNCWNYGLPKFIVESVRKFK